MSSDNSRKTKKSFKVAKNALLWIALAVGALAVIAAAGWTWSQVGFKP